MYIFWCNLDEFSLTLSPLSLSFSFFHTLRMPQLVGCLWLLFLLFSSSLFLVLYFFFILFQCFCFSNKQYFVCFSVAFVKVSSVLSICVVFVLFDVSVFCKLLLKYSPGRVIITQLNYCWMLTRFQFAIFYHFAFVVFFLCYFRWAIEFFLVSIFSEDRIFQFVVFVLLLIPSKL